MSCGLLPHLKLAAVNKAVPTRLTLELMYFIPIVYGPTKVIATYFTTKKSYIIFNEFFLTKAFFKCKCFLKK